MSDPNTPYSPPPNAKWPEPEGDGPPSFRPAGGISGFYPDDRTNGRARVEPVPVRLEDIRCDQPDRCDPGCPDQHDADRHHVRADEPLAGLAADDRVERARPDRECGRSRCLVSLGPGCGGIRARHPAGHGLGRRGRGAHARHRQRAQRQPPVDSRLVPAMPSAACATFSVSTCSSQQPEWRCRSWSSSLRC